MIAGLPPWWLYISGVFNVTLTHCPPPPPPPRKIMTRFKKKDKPCFLIDAFRSFHENALRSMAWGLTDNHYNDVIMSAMASQITGFSIVYLTVSLGAYQIKHQSFASLAFVRGIHRWQENSPHKGSVTRKIKCFLLTTLSWSRHWIS